MSLFTTIQAKFAAYAKTVSAKVTAFASYFLPKAEALVEVAIDDLVAIAGTAVLDQAAKVVSGQVKYQNAINAVIDTVQASGKTVAQNTAAAAVQLAYLEFQKQVLGK